MKERKRLGQDPSDTAHTEAHFINSLAACFTPERVRMYTPPAQKHLIRVLRQAIELLEEDLQEQLKELAI